MIQDTEGPSVDFEVCTDSHPEKRIGGNLRRIRQERNLSLQQLAEQTLVSKPMLSQIERGTSSPTISVLWKIAAGLRIPLSALLKEKSGYFQTADPTGEPVFEEDGMMKAWLLFAGPPNSLVDVYWIEMDPGCCHESLGHQDGTREYILPALGEVTIACAGKKTTLCDGKSVSFDASVTHSYENKTEKKISFYNVISYQ